MSPDKQGLLAAFINPANELPDHIGFVLDNYHLIEKPSMLRCYISCFQNDLGRALAFANKALEELPSNETSLGPGIHQALGDTLRRNGYWKEARESYLNLMDCTHMPACHVQAVHLFGAWADLELWQGRLREAAEFWRKALRVIDQDLLRLVYPLPVTGWVYIRMGELLFAWNELSKAREHLSRGLEHVELGGDVRAKAAGYLLSCRLKLYEGNAD